MAKADSYAKRFRQTREAHRNEVAEDYVEAILDLTEEAGEARVTSIARRLGVAHPTVTKAMNRLAREGYVGLEPYRPVVLTQRGKDLAMECRRRHRVVVSFLLALGVEAEEAELEAEGIEHHVSGRTIELMARFARS